MFAQLTYNIPITMLSKMKSTTLELLFYLFQLALPVNRNENRYHSFSLLPHKFCGRLERLRGTKITRLPRLL